MKLVTNYPSVTRHVDLAFRRAVDEVVGEARMNVGVSVSRGLKLNAGDVQGGMRASVDAQHTGRLHARVGSQHRGAMMREKGGTILPVRGRFLSWVDPVTGKRIYASSSSPASSAGGAAGARGCSPRATCSRSSWKRS
jgi:hypothetical protein